MVYKAITQSYCKAERFIGKSVLSVLTWLRGYCGVPSRVSATTHRHIICITMLYNVPPLIYWTEDIVQMDIGMVCIGHLIKLLERIN